VTNPARRDSFLDTHVIGRRDRCAARMEHRPSGVWGAVVEIQDDRILRQWSRERGWMENEQRTLDKRGFDQLASPRRASTAFWSGSLANTRVFISGPLQAAC
jgi:hypothetical protein